MAGATETSRPSKEAARSSTASARRAHPRSAPPWSRSRSDPRSAGGQQEGGAAAGRRRAALSRSRATGAEDRPPGPPFGGRGGAKPGAVLPGRRRQVEQNLLPLILVPTYVAFPIAFRSDQRYVRLRIPSFSPDPRSPGGSHGPDHHQARGGGDRRRLLAPLHPEQREGTQWRGRWVRNRSLAPSPERGPRRREAHIFPLVGAGAWNEEPVFSILSSDASLPPRARHRPEPGLKKISGRVRRPRRS